MAYEDVRSVAVQSRKKYLGACHEIDTLNDIIDEQRTKVILNDTKFRKFRENYQMQIMDYDAEIERLKQLVPPEVEYQVHLKDERDEAKNEIVRLHAEAEKKVKGF